jgi:hypothetical protein
VLQEPSVGRNFVAIPSGAEQQDTSPAISPADHSRRGRHAMQHATNLSGWLDENGQFRYARYCAIQKKPSRRKIDRVLVSRIRIALVSYYLRRHLYSEIRFSVCHDVVK